MNLEELQGGFSVQIMQEVKNYIKNGLIRGWLGHENRSNKLDRMIENLAEKQGLSKQFLAEWIISKCGRFYGDSISYHDEDHKDCLIDYFNNFKEG